VRLALVWARYGKVGKGGVASAAEKSFPPHYLAARGTAQARSSAPTTAVGAAFLLSPGRGGAADVSDPRNREREKERARASDWSVGPLCRHQIAKQRA
jgi:hypothetical protein